MTVRAIDTISLEQKRVFIRVDFNVPLGNNNQILDDTRIRATLPTIQYALKKKARVILASHLGRPKGEKNLKYSLAPVAEALLKLLDLPEIIFPEDCLGDGVKKLSKEMKPGEVMLLENLRFHPEEEKNDERFSESLASLCDVYINDAFGSAHRAHASTTGMVHFVKEKGAGFLMQKEINFLTELLKNPKHPFVAILGGSKVSDKIGVIENLLNQVDTICLGGALAYTFLKAKGFDIGNSKIEEEKIHIATKILDRAKTKGVAIFLASDHIIAKKIDAEAALQTTTDENIPTGWMGVDVGPKTIEIFEKELRSAKTIFWNGPLGIYEIEKFAQGTYSMAQILSKLKVTTVIGGGDCTAAVQKLGLGTQMTHLSTGGGASLEFLEGKKLPGIEALEES